MIGLVYFLISLLITVTIHELAHMMVAIWSGVRVKAFSIGFARVLLHKKLWGIDFRLSLIPLGGYCQLAEKGADNWIYKRYAKKLAIVLAGVTANLILAFICYYINYGSIELGLKVDFLLMKYIFTKDYDSIYNLILAVQPNVFLLQLGIMNLFGCLSNLMPIPGLDGGYVFLFWFQKLLKDKFEIFLKVIIKIGMVFLGIIQFVLLYYIWFM